MVIVTKVSQQDFDRNGTLEMSDIGKWALIINGAWHIGYASEDEAKLAKSQLEN